MFGREVGLVRVRVDQGQGVTEVNHRDLVGHGWQRLHAWQRRVGGDLIEHAGENLSQHGEHVAVVADEAELDIQRHIFGEMACGVMRFGAEHRPGLINPLEHSYHHLLVQLRGLRQIRGATKIVQAEHVRA